MEITRREFLKLTTIASGGLLLPASQAVAATQGPYFPLHKKVKEAATICPYCSCGCGLIIATGPDGRIINAEGDPDNITNRGALDPKSISVRQLSQSQLRLKKPLYRAPGASQWQEVEWDWAIAEIAKRIKAARDATFERTAQVGDKTVTVNRTRAIAFLGGAANNSEECYLAAKLCRALGILYLEHQARI